MGSYRLDSEESWFDSHGKQILSSPKQPDRREFRNFLVHGEAGTLFPEVKRPECEANNLFPFTVEFGVSVGKNLLSTFLHIVQRGKFTWIKLMKISGRKGPGTVCLLVEKKERGQAEVMSIRH
jgi:hypothetical protein